MLKHLLALSNWVPLLACPAVRVSVLALSLAAALLGGSRVAQADAQVLSAPMRHLRSGATREWSDFPRASDGDRLTVSFNAKENQTPQTLTLRQQDVKQRWSVTLNGRKLGLLTPDENDQFCTFTLSPGALVEGDNTLVVQAASRESDDIRIGDIRLDPRPPEQALAEATVNVEIISTETGKPMPGRITIVHSSGALAALANTSDATHAVRAGVVYTADGTAEIRLPHGQYTLYAGRGFEYGIASTAIELHPGDTISRRLASVHEVSTPGYVSCDTHCHTFTYSRHGDATLAERLVTLAGEGIELPVATDHNLQIDYRPADPKSDLFKYFTPIVGNEVTTRVGHFNVFPLTPGGTIDPGGRTWSEVFAQILHAPGSQVIVLNHADDIHAGFRPFGAERHIDLTGEDLDGWKLEANAMEVINSGATLNDPMQLVRGWFGMLNAGVNLAPVGASDSHDVSRYIVGQGRTYVRADDTDPSRIDIAQACRSFRQGRVHASLGLLAEVTVDGQYGPGDLVPAKKSVRVHIRVSGPSWTQVEQVALYANGVLVRECPERLLHGTVIYPPGTSPPGIDKKASMPPGVKWTIDWTLDLGKQDVYLVAVARGPGVRELYWPIARPYQPTSQDWKPYVLGISGAVRIDADGQPGFTCAKDYAQSGWRESNGDIPRFMQLLSPYDASVAAQAAGILRVQGHDPFDESLRDALATASPAVRSGFNAYRAAWRASQAARASAAMPRP